MGRGGGGEAVDVGRDEHANERLEGGGMEGEGCGSGGVWEGEVCRGTLYIQ